MAAAGAKATVPGQGASAKAANGAVADAAGKAAEELANSKTTQASRSMRANQTHSSHQSMRVGLVQVAKCRILRSTVAGAEE